MIPTMLTTSIWQRENTIKLLKNQKYKIFQKQKNALNLKINSIFNEILLNKVYILDNSDESFFSFSPLIP
jgi:hypothetical protein